MFRLYANRLIIHFGSNMLLFLPYILSTHRCVRMPSLHRDKYLELRTTLKMRASDGFMCQCFHFTFILTCILKKMETLDLPKNWRRCRGAALAPLPINLDQIS